MPFCYACFKPKKPKMTPPKKQKIVPGVINKIKSQKKSMEYVETKSKHSPNGSQQTLQRKLCQKTKKQFETSSGSDTSSSSSQSKNSQLWNERQARINSRVVKNESPGSVSKKSVDSKETSLSSTPEAEVKELDNFNFVVAEKRFNSANEKVQLGDFRSALINYTQAIALNDHKASYFYQRAVCHYVLGKFPEALDDAFTVVLFDIKYPGGFETLLRAALAMGDIEKCDFVVNQPNFSNAGSSQLNYTNVNDVDNFRDLKDSLEMVEKQKSCQDYYTALIYTEKAIDIAVGNMDLRMSKVELLFRLSRHKEAIEFYENTKGNARPVSSEEFYACALCEYYQDNMEASLRACRDAIRQPSYKSKCLKLLKKLKNLQETREKGRSKYGTHTQESYYLFIECLNKLSDLDEFLTSKNVIIESKVLCNLAKLAKHWDDALEFIDQAIALNSDFAKCFAVRGNLYRDKLRFGEAINDYEMFLSIDPSNAQVQKELNYCQSIISLQQKRDFYEILGVERQASKAEITSAYRKLALVHHPDKHSNDVAPLKEQHESIFKKICHAFKVLSY